MPAIAQSDPSSSRLPPVLQNVGFTPPLNGHLPLDLHFRDEAGVELRFHEFSPFEYPQLHGAFEPGLSCVDYVANCGFTPWKAS